ncbi:hypothetical protein [Pseudomonas synxantha]|uniref:hypothetical protein n=1 Tax=Pseudomonas synxantha TaxID=47883 RepID=UPI00345DF0F2
MLSETLPAAQRSMIADNGASIAEAHFSENAWFRAIYADETLIGFIMLHIGAITMRAFITLAYFFGVL